MGFEIDEEEFKAVVDENRHNELVELLTTISESLRKDESADNQIAATIERHIKSVDAFIAYLKSIPKPKDAAVTVNTNQDKVVASIQAMAQSLIENITALRTSIENSKPSEWVFHVNKGEQGIESVTAIPTYNKQLNTTQS